MLDDVNDYVDSDDDYVPPQLVGSPLIAPRPPGAPANLAQWDEDEDEDDANDVDYVPQYGLQTRRTTRMSTPDRSKSTVAKKKRTKKRRRKVVVEEAAAVTASASSVSGEGGRGDAESTQSKTNPPAVIPSTSLLLPVRDEGTYPVALPPSSHPNINAEEIENGDSFEDDEGDDDESASDDDVSFLSAGDDEDEGESSDGEEDTDVAHSLEVDDVPAHLRDLRVLYEQCLVQVAMKGGQNRGGRLVGADRLALAQGLRLHLNEGDLADELLVLQSHIISWDSLVSCSGQHGSARIRPVPESSSSPAPLLRQEILKQPPAQPASTGWTQAARADVAKVPKPLPVKTTPLAISTSDEEDNPKQSAPKTSAIAHSSLPEGSQQSPKHPVLVSPNPKAQIESLQMPSLPFSGNSIATHPQQVPLALESESIPADASTVGESSQADATATSAVDDTASSGPSSPGKVYALDLAMRKALTDSAQKASQQLALAEAKSHREREGGAFSSDVAQLSAPPKPPKPSQSGVVPRSQSPQRGTALVSSQAPSQHQHQHHQHQHHAQQSKNPNTHAASAAHTHSHSHVKPLSPGRAQSSKKLALRASRDLPLVISPELSEHFCPPPLSDYAEKTGAILEGWLEKKSKAGLWQRRFFVLAESKTDFCVLKIYQRALQAAWGDVPIHLKSTIPVFAMEIIESKTATDSTASGREFLVQVGDCRDFHLAFAGDDGEDGVSAWRELFLRAEDAQTRLLWELFLKRARTLALDAFE